LLKDITYYFREGRKIRIKRSVIKAKVKTKGKRAHRIIIDYSTLNSLSSDIQ